MGHSDSRRPSPPWAGLAAVLCVLISDHWLATEGNLWDWTVAHVDEQQLSESGIARERAQFCRLVESPADRPRVFVLGSDRAERDLSPAAMDEVLGDRAQAVVLAHAGLGVLEVVALADELFRSCWRTAPGSRADVLVLALSELEIMSPLQLRAGRAAGSAVVLGDLLELGGVGFAADNRDTLLRLALSTVLNCHRFRGLVAALGWRPAAWTGERSAALPSEADARLRRLAMAFPAVPEALLSRELSQVLSLGEERPGGLPGQLLARAVQRLNRIGVALVVLELPLHPLARQWYDVSLREDSLRFFADLAVDFGVTVITEEMVGPFAKSDFADLTQLVPDAAVGLSRSLARRVLQVFSEGEGRVQR